MSVGTLSVELKLRYDGEKWLLYRADGHYWELKKDFSDIGNGIKALLVGPMLELETSLKGFIQCP